MSDETIEETSAQDNESTTELFIVDKIKEVSDIKSRYTPEQINFVKGLVNKDLTDSELFMFLAYANQLKLNPMNKEIIAVVYNGQHGRTVNTITTRDGKRVVATRTGELDGIMSTPIYIKEVELPVPQPDPANPEKTITVKIKTQTQVEPWEGGILWGATCTVLRKGKEYKATVPFKEYNTGKNLWIGKPETMIKKVAESQALSMAFPEILTGLYDESEMGDIKTIEVPEQTDDGTPATEEQIATIINFRAKKADKASDINIPEDGNITKVEAGKLIAQLAKL